jgi:nitrate/nitrite transport system substrate-binding protein
MWLYYWLASGGINPFDDIRTVVVPPPQMVMNMRIGNMSGFCVGEPWNARAINDRIGFTAATSQDIWPEHPEKFSAPAANGLRVIPTPRARWWRR